MWAKLSFLLSLLDAVQGLLMDSKRYTRDLLPKVGTDVMEEWRVLGELERRKAVLRQENQQWNRIGRQIEQ